MKRIDGGVAHHLVDLVGAELRDFDLVRVEA